MRSNILDKNKIREYLKNFVPSNDRACFFKIKRDLYLFVGVEYISDIDIRFVIKLNSIKDEKENKTVNLDDIELISVIPMRGVS
ncbi:hypothetical protein [Acetivibrio cellulolyticus]|uniref:hypothetical protein n=1 Tax=Acetivibrio cellulolyticus TaxID=35830 RepID=UPI0001E2F0E2|nr:hypothetical protein [Acetivibrio cellulolyticus]